MVGRDLGRSVFQPDWDLQEMHHHKVCRPTDPQKSQPEGVGVRRRGVRYVRVVSELPVETMDSAAWFRSWRLAAIASKAHSATT
jgi:hypothetical protein